MYGTREYFETKVLTRISRDIIILTGDCALNYLGYSVSGVYIPDVLTDIHELKDVRVAGRVNYCYTPNLDKEHYVTKLKGFDKVLLPTAERVFVECIKSDLEFIDEGYFCDALERYTHSSNFDHDKLYEVADFFGVERSKVDYWLEEASDYNSY